MKQSGFGIASLVLGIVGILLSCIAIGVVPAIIGLIFAIIGLSAKDKKHGTAVAGLICSIVAIVIFLLFVLVIGSSDDTGNQNNKIGTADSQVENTKEKTKEETKEETKEQIEEETKEEINESETINFKTKTEENGTSKNEEVFIERICIFDSQDVKIYAESIEKSISTWKIKIYIENNSLLNLGFNARAYAVNGIMTGNNIYSMDCDVASGKKAYTYIDIEKSFLEENCIDAIKYVDVLFWAYDNDKYMKEFDTDQVVINTSIYTAKDGEYLIGENVYNNNGLIIDEIETNKNSFSFVITNKTGSYLDFDVENITINDYTSSDIDYDLIGVIVLNDCQAEFVINVSNDFLTTTGIDQIENVEFSLNVRPKEDYFEAWNTDMIIYEVK